MNPIPSPTLPQRIEDKHKLKKAADLGFLGVLAALGVGWTAPAFATDLPPDLVGLIPSTDVTSILGAVIILGRAGLDVVKSYLENKELRAEVAALRTSIEEAKEREASAQKKLDAYIEAERIKEVEALEAKLKALEAKLNNLPAN